MEDMRLISSYKTVEKEFAEASFTEKKSEFIGYAARVETEEAAKSFIERIRRKHSDATHNCYAYLLKDSGLSRFSDDGEPSGTAGRQSHVSIVRIGRDDRDFAQYRRLSVTQCEEHGTAERAGEGRHEQL